MMDTLTVVALFIILSASPGGELVNTIKINLVSTDAACIVQLLWVGMQTI